MKLSYWEQKYYFEDIDLLIIGAGIVGLSTAISAKQIDPDQKIVILERSPLPLGASTKNAGFACFGSITELMADSQTMTRDQQIELVRMRWHGLSLMLDHVEGSDIDYHAHGGIELLDTESDDILAAIEAIPYYNDVIYEAIGLRDCFSVRAQSVSDSFHREAIYNQYEGQLNPVKMMTALQSKAASLGVKTLYGVTVSEVASHEAIANDKHISARQIAVCTNGLTRSLLTLDLQAVRNQVYVTEPLDDHPLRSCYHYDQGYIYFREVDGRILIGGARNQFSAEETTDQLGMTNELRLYLEDFVSDRIMRRRVKLAYGWSGILGVGAIKAPIIKQVSPDLYVGVRLGGMGVAIGSKVGQQLAELMSRGRNIQR